MSDGAYAIRCVCDIYFSIRQGCGVELHSVKLELLMLEQTNEIDLSTGLQITGKTYTVRISAQDLRVSYVTCGIGSTARIPS